MRVFLDTIPGVFGLECAGSPNAMRDGLCVVQIKHICNKIKVHIKFYAVQQLPTSTRLCQDAQISIDIIYGLLLVLCGTRLPLYPQPFLKPRAGNMS